jgi:sulfatase maturation enzyme AslB (radical SAM superfamily)
MKILCLGNNTEDTDIKTCDLAKVNLTACHGLLSELDGAIGSIAQEGWYHSSVYDIEYGRLVELSSKFDSVIMLAQPKEQYSHPDAFYKTVRLVKNLPNGKFLDSGYTTDIDFFENLVKTNKSFCIFPFIELLTNQRSDGYTTLCARSSEPVAHISEITNWKTNKHYKHIRTSMINGKQLPKHCSTCYKLENKNIVSAREQETIEWANRLNLTSLEDLGEISYPVYYEIRPSNICNLQCRMCSPSSSHLIGREYKKINLIDKIPTPERSDFSIINFNNLKKLYVAGGEPTAMPEFYEFLDQCIQNKQTDFEFVVNTNGTKLNNRFKKQLQQFSNFQFIVSIDGIGPINTYIRWPSQWKNIIENVHYLRKNNHVVSVNTTVSIYNVLNLYELLEFFDNEFPNTLVHAQLVESNKDILSGLRFPDAKLAYSKLLPIQQLKCYKNDPLLKSFIDAIISHYQYDPELDLEKLSAFFKFNDALDKSRSVLLNDYIPELEMTRKLL